LGSLRLAIIVPTLDEEEALASNLPQALAAADEVVISDGGSTDATVAVARRLGAHVVTGPPGRGPQLNRGAEVARAEGLLFLHADSRLPAGGGEAIRQALAAGHDGGGFLLQFDVERPVFRLMGRLVDLRTRISGLPLGDQGQFVSSQAFSELGGFRDWPILEDLDFARRLRRGRSCVVLPMAVTSSARRYVQRGVVRTALTNWLIWSLFLAGVPPSRLARWYRHVR
jgi:uncharacterized protein